MNYYLPVLIVVGANIIYHLSSKNISAEISPFLSLTLVYLVAATISAIIFISSNGLSEISSQLKLVNWSTFTLGTSIVALEFGFIMLYRVGWNISVGALVCNILLSVALLIIGLLLYKEHISIAQGCGMVLCIIGLWLIVIKK